MQREIPILPHFHSIFSSLTNQRGIYESIPFSCLEGSNLSRQRLTRLLYMPRQMHYFNFIM